MNNLFTRKYCKEFFHAYCPPHFNWFNDYDIFSKVHKTGPVLNFGCSAVQESKVILKQIISFITAI